mgnify:CR=1 FL=1|tara:strand:- start:29 stop:1093 length:1065 start_codon:yes stop_codon:yes gene_type:complete
MLTFEDFTFGVEVEFTGAELVDVETGMQAALANTNIDVVRESYNHCTRNHWKVTTDATVTEHRNYSRGTGFGGELVSPVLRGHAGFAELEQVLAALNSVAGVTGDDVRCGLHVHLGWRGINVQHVKNIVQRYAHHEQSIDAWMSPSRRANNSRWCSSIAGNGYPLRTVASHSGSLSSMAGLAGRYYKVNLQSLSRYTTVEFRQHQGTTDYSKISSWIKFLMAFCQTSKHRTVTACDVSYKRQKRSQAFGEVRELFEARNWTVRFGGGKWKFSDELGNIRHELTNNEMFAFYVNGVINTGGLAKARARQVLNQEFINFYQQCFTNGQIDDVFEGCDADVRQFLIDRTAHFARRAA